MHLLAPALRCWAGWLMALVCLLVSMNWWQDGGFGFDHRSSNAWREADYVSIARAFVHEDINPLYPRVLWRGEGTGEVEMEAPMGPWLAALAGRAIGYDDSLIRRISTIFAAGAVALFGWLAHRRLSPLPALFALTFFAASPIVQVMATAMQPEAIALFFTVGTVLAALSWYETGSSRWWWIGVASLSFALLAKASSAYLLIFCGLLVWKREGVPGLSSPRAMLAISVSLVLPLLWYLHANGLYARTGLSLGLSNETHLINAGVLAEPWPVIRGNLAIEARYVLGSVAGAVLCLIGACRRAQSPVLLLVASVAVYYLVISDTSGDLWAWYYHVASVLPVALLVGAGVESLQERLRGARRARIVSAVLVTALMMISSWAVLGEAQHTRALLSQRDAVSPVPRLCIRELAEQLPADALVLTRGGAALDRHGHPVAYNESPPFVWAERFGANFPSDLAGKDPFIEYADRQAPWYWLARADDAELVDDYEGLSQLAAGYPVIARCSLDPRYALVSLSAVAQDRMAR
ncbi:MAG TPA: glycosyltransferase family 39 protein [Burkholderiaceae bacterium]|nr:glycosyltransferase family 39 protein [Burkholderiaceae bacterium]